MPAVRMLHERCYSGFFQHGQSFVSNMLRLSRLCMVFMLPQINRSLHLPHQGFYQRSFI